MIACSLIKQALSEYLLANVDVQQVRDMCVATIPFTTVDNRWIDIFIESRQADYFLIHDGGKAVNELILQGVKITPSVEKDLGIIAQRMGVAYSDEMFQDGGKIGQIAEKAYAIGMSSALAMAQLLERVDIAAEDPLEGQIGTLLRKWGGTKAQIKRGVKVQGGLKQHSFDFVVSPRKKGPSIALSILNPTAGALSAAERFGFKAKDLERTQFSRWKRIAVEAKSEVWSKEAHRIVENCADAVVEIPSGSPATYDQISEAIDRAVAA